ncbi:hypothetical protein [Microcoleus sp. bin38.metabat.b11b12b14.051]|uniref:hypothetical protein n=1 Tax=Microcoleus sp. bin38.metabat.b11b12b14.051 TaxID=2742709 RepID=UPI0025FF2B29|nr:hypothetical protein [Microcoleus sp. bin38.metabat.b11b12b14.051]
MICGDFSIPQGRSPLLGKRRQIFLLAQLDRALIRVATVLLGAMCRSSRHTKKP